MMKREHGGFLWLFALVATRTVSEYWINPPEL